MSKKRQNQEVNISIADLPEIDRKILSLKFSGYKYKEIDNKLNLDYKTTARFFEKERKGNIYRKLDINDLEELRRMWIEYVNENAIEEKKLPGKSVLIRDLEEVFFKETIKRDLYYIRAASRKGHPELAWEWIREQEEKFLILSNEVQPDGWKHQLCVEALAWVLIEKADTSRYIKTPDEATQIHKTVKKTITELNIATNYPVLDNLLHLIQSMYSYGEAEFIEAIEAGENIVASGSLGEFSDLYWEYISIRLVGISQAYLGKKKEVKESIALMNKLDNRNEFPAILYMLVENEYRIQAILGSVININQLHHAKLFEKYPYLELVKIRTQLDSMIAQEAWDIDFANQLNNRAEELKFFSQGYREQVLRRVKKIAFRAQVYSQNNRDNALQTKPSTHRTKR